MSIRDLILGVLLLFVLNSVCYADECPKADRPLFDQYIVEQKARTEGYDKGKKEMYEALAKYVYEHCALSGCGFTVPSHSLMDTLIDIAK